MYMQARMARSGAVIAEARTGDASVADRCTVLRTSDGNVGEYLVYTCDQILGALIL